MKFLKIAEGLADVYPRLGPTCEWDTAAAHAVVLGVGGLGQGPERGRAPVRSRTTSSTCTLSYGDPWPPTDGQWALDHARSCK